MAFTTNWIWGPISRSLDMNVVDETDTYTRNNWTLQRFRFTDEEAASELNETTEALAAFSGNQEVIETVVQQSAGAYVTFSANTAWTLSTTKWYETDYIYNGMPTYKPDPATTNMPDSTKTNAIQLIKRSGNFFWVVSEYTAEAVANGTFRDVVNPNYRNILAMMKVQNINARVFDRASDLVLGGGGGTFTGTATATSTGAAVGIPFRCVQDDKEYEPLTKWFKQTQTWAYKDEWKLDT